MNSFFCSSVPHCKMVGPTRVSPKKSARRGAPARATPRSDDLLEEAQALAAVLGGSWRRSAASKSLAVQDSWNSLRCSGVISNPGSPHPREVLFEPRPDLLGGTPRLQGIGQIHAPRVATMPRASVPRPAGRARAWGSVCVWRQRGGGCPAMTPRVGTSLGRSPSPALERGRESWERSRTSRCRRPSRRDPQSRCLRIAF